MLAIFLIPKSPGIYREPAGRHGTGSGSDLEISVKTKNNLYLCSRTFSLFEMFPNIFSLVQ